MTAAKALRTCIRTCSVFRNGRLNTNIKVHRVQIKSVVIYACPTCVYAANAYGLKYQRLQNTVLGAIGNLDRCTPVRKLRMTFKIPYIYDYVTKLCRTRTEVILKNANPNVRVTGNEK
jgi:hypothetical protein